MLLWSALRACDLSAPSASAPKATLSLTNLRVFAWLAIVLLFERRDLNASRP